MNKMVIIATAAVLTLGGGGAGAYFLVLKDDPETESELTDANEVEMPEPEELGPPLFHTIPPLIVSSNYLGSLRYLQIKMSIMTRDEEVLENLEASTPLIQDSLIMLLDSYEFGVLENPEGKEDLRQKAEHTVRELTGNEGIESVLFTGFVIQ